MGNFSPHGDGDGKEVFPDSVHGDGDGDILSPRGRGWWLVPPMGNSPLPSLIANPLHEHGLHAPLPVGLPSPLAPLPSPRWRCHLRLLLRSDTYAALEVI
jgi:hypothetical protein